MAEWLILLLLVPAIVVPVVLLVGFTGCTFVPNIGVPTIVFADALSDSSIAVKWYGNFDIFQLERINPDQSTNDFFSRARSPIPAPSTTIPALHRQQPIIIMCADF
jgi:hypothetical protein